MTTNQNPETTLTVAQGVDLTNIPEILTLLIPVRPHTYNPAVIEDLCLVIMRSLNGSMEVESYHALKENGGAADILVSIHTAATVEQAKAVMEEVLPGEYFGFAGDGG